MDLKHASFIDPCNDNNFINSTVFFFFFLLSHFSLRRESKDNPLILAGEEQIRENIFPPMGTHPLRPPSIREIFLKNHIARPKVCRANEREPIENRIVSQFPLESPLSTDSIRVIESTRRIFHPRCHYYRHFPFLFSLFLLFFQRPDSEI